MNRATEDLTTFEVLWYSGGPEYAPNRCIGRDRFKARDVSAAITRACNMLKAGKGAHDGMARGFYVREAEPQGNGWANDHLTKGAS